MGYANTPGDGMTVQTPVSFDYPTALAQADNAIGECPVLSQWRQFRYDFNRQQYRRWMAGHRSKASLWIYGLPAAKTLTI